MRSRVLGLRLPGLKLPDWRLLGLAFLVLLGPGWPDAYASPTEPSASWVYPYFDQLRLAGRECPFFVMTGPYERLDVARWLEGERDRGSHETARVKWLRRMLRQEFAPEIAFEKAADMVWSFDTALGSRFEKDRRVKPELLSGLRVYTKEGLCLWTSLRVTANAPGNHKVETQPWEERWRASCDYGGIGYDKGRFSVFMGRDEVSWGASRQLGLLFSGVSPSMDMLKFTIRSKNLLFTSFHSELRRGDADPWDAKACSSVKVRRFVSAHQLELLLGHRLDLSLSEAVIYGGEGRDFELGYLNPLAPFYAEQWNSDWNDNIFIDGGFSFLFPGRAEVRGEVMVDDFQIDFKSEPNEMGFGLSLNAVNPLLGDAAHWGCSYFRVANRTYGHRIAWNRFMQEGKVMGYPDGPDGDRFGIWSSWAPEDALELRIGYGLKRQGEDRASDPQDEKGRPGKFPSGTVETVHTVGADVSWRPSYVFLVRGAVEWSNETSIGNVRGEDRSGLNFILNLTYNLRFARESLGSMSQW